MKKESRDIVLLIFISAIGLFVRLSAALSVSFPLNDGGLFYRMILDLQRGHFALPMITSYNQANIPFAYPPFAFYVYAIISTLGHVSVLTLMQFLPTLISVLSIPIFFLFAREILETKAQVLLSTLVFSLVPRAFDWLIMGGGVTRSLGFLFALLSIHQALLLFTAPTAKKLLLTTLFSGLVILTHPEAAIHTLIACIFIYAWKDHTLKGFQRAGMVAMGSLLLSSPWWVSILVRHGFGPFNAILSSAGQDSPDLIARVLNLFRFDFSDEPFLALTSVFGLIGIFMMLALKKPAMPAWILLIQLIEPRGGSLYMMIPLSIGAAFGLDLFILQNLQTPETPEHSQSLLKLNLEKIFIGFIFLYGILSASIVMAKISRQLTLISADLQAFNWVEEHVPASRSFVLITHGAPLNDSTSEWFPALTDHTSLATIFGQEWIDDGEFGAHVESYKSLQTCGTLGISCLNNWARASNTNFSFIYIRKIQGITVEPSILAEQLERSTKYRLIYQTEEVEIFERK